MMDAVHEPGIRGAAIVTSNQVGKTTTIENINGYFIHWDPCPILGVLPTLAKAAEFSKERLSPMIENTPELQALVARARARSSDNTILTKAFPNGHLALAGSNSPAGLASRDRRFVWGDEIDSFKPSAGALGDAIELARRRMETYQDDAFEIWTSTPGIKGLSRIWDLWEKSDQRYYFVPCPKCGEMQVLRWENVHWDKDTAGKYIPGTAYITCVLCKDSIREHDKTWFLERGEWRATAPCTGLAGFHLWAAYSPWCKLDKIVAEFFLAFGSPEKRQVWCNGYLGEPFVDQGETVEAAGLLARRKPFPAEVPAGALVLTAAVDAHPNRLEVLVEGWGPGDPPECWDIDHRIILGDPAVADTWKRLDQVIFGTYQHQSGARLPISMTLVDSGYMAETIYAYVHPRQVRQVYVAKGMSDETAQLVGKPSKQFQGKGRRAVLLFPIGPSTGKSIIYHRLKITDPGPGYRHLPDAPWCSEEWAAQLTSEILVTEMHRGRPKRRWKKKPNVENHVLDMAVLNLAAIALVNPRWESLLEASKRWGLAKAQQAAGGATTATGARQPARRPAGTFATRWKK